MREPGRDPDLIPPDQVQRIAPAEIVHTPRGPLWVDTIGSAAWADVQHNQARYAELEQLRRGQKNRYHETRYRP